VIFFSLGAIKFVVPCFEMVKDYSSLRAFACASRKQNEPISLATERFTIMAVTVRFVLLPMVLRRC
jgi:hypothetical protein